MQVLYGIHSVKTVLQRYPERIKQLFINRDQETGDVNAIIQLADVANISMQTMSKQQLNNMVGHANHQGIVANCAPARVYQEKELSFILDFDQESLLLLILDGIQDPHNLGACFRTAEAAGVNAIIATERNSVSLTPTVRKVACGAADIVPFVQIKNLARSIKLLQEQNIWLWGTDVEAETSLYKVDLKGSIALVLGSEGKGLRRLTKESCDGLLRIPMQGVTPSLNVSVAAGICLFEAIRQRTLVSFIELE